MLLVRLKWLIKYKRLCPQTLVQAPEKITTTFNSLQDKTQLSLE